MTAGQKRTKKTKKSTTKKSNGNGASRGDAAQTVQSPDAVQQAMAQAQSVLCKLPLVGPVLWLYANSPLHKYTFVADFEWLVLPPLVKEQCKLYMKGDAPLAFASWAFVGERVEKRLLSGHNRLAPTEWACGDRLWLIDLVTPFGGAQDIVRDIRENVFPDRTIRYLVPDFKRKGVQPVVWRAAPTKPKARQ